MEQQEQGTYLKILRSITFLEQFGPFIKPPHSKKIYDALYELRVVGKESIRIFYTIRRGTYYLIHGFKKKTQKTPTKEIQTALDRIQKLI